MASKIDSLIKFGFEHNVSDIHLTVGVPPTLRINGELKPYGDEILKPSDTLEMAKEMIPQNMWETFRANGEFDFSYAIEKLSRFRVNAFLQRNSVSLAIRIIPQDIPTLEQLKVPSVLRQIIKKPQGLFLVTGPTGSGKSTTLASMIHEMNVTMEKHIITLEDPIEYLHQHRRSIVNQREVGLDTKTFSNGLRAALRQDPDVILLGEMRDLETISTAITAAETGHLVLATLHTSNAPSTIDRIIDVFEPSQQKQVRIQLASVLVGILSQRLFPTSDRNGRCIATELLINNAAIGNLIRNEKVHQITSVMQTSKALGMHTLDVSMMSLVEQGAVDYELIKPYLREGS